MHAGAGIPLGIPLDVAVKQQIAEGELVRLVGGVERDLARLELFASGHGEARQFGAIVGIVQAAGQAGRDRLRVGDAVIAREGIGAEDARQVEILQRTVIHRQEILVLVGCVGVEQARFQRLLHLAPEQRGVAFEHQAAVHRDGRQHAAGAGGAIGHGGIGLVVRGVQLQRRRDIAPGADPGIAQLAKGIAARSVGIAGELGARLEARDVQIE